MRRAALATFLTATERLLRAGGRLLIFGFCARFYSVADVSAYAYLLFWGTAIGMVADLGLTGYVERELPARLFHAPLLVRGALRARLTGLLLSIVAAWLLVTLTTRTLSWSSLGTLALASSLTAGDFLGSLSRGHGRYDHALRDSGLPIVCACVVGGIVCLSGGSFDLFQIVTGLAATIPAALTLAVRLKLTPANARPPSTFELISASKWFLAGAVMGWVRFEFGVVILQHLSNPTATALYAATLRPVGLLSQGLLVSAMVFAPSLSHRNAAQDPRRFEASIHRWHTIVLSLLSPGYALCMLVGRQLLRVFGPEYRSADSVLSLLALGVVVNMAVLTPQPLIAIHKESAAVAIAGVALVVNLLLALLLVPMHGAEGAAWAFLLATIVTKLAYVLAYRTVGLALGNHQTVGLTLLVAAWFTVVLLLPDAYRMAFMVFGLVGGGIHATWLLARTRLF
jgi:O-antigen/teichoic acid export membrane protein